MRRRQPKINWFLVVLVVILIAVVTYVDRFILPTAQTPFMPTPTTTRDPESYVTEAEGDFANGKLLDAINTYLEAIRSTPKDPSLYIALARVQIFAGKYADALVNAENALLLNPNSSMAQALRGWALTEQGNYTAADDSLCKTRFDWIPTTARHMRTMLFYMARCLRTAPAPYINPVETAKDESRTATTMAPTTWRPIGRARMFTNSPATRNWLSRNTWLPSISIKTSLKSTWNSA